MLSTKRLCRNSLLLYWYIAVFTSSLIFNANGSDDVVHPTSETLLHSSYHARGIYTGSGNLFPCSIANFHKDLWHTCHIVYLLLMLLINYICNFGLFNFILVNPLSIVSCTLMKILNEKSILVLCRFFSAPSLDIIASSQNNPRVVQGLGVEIVDICYSRRYFSSKLIYLILFCNQ